MPAGGKKEQGGQDSPGVYCEDEIAGVSARRSVKARRSAGRTRRSPSASAKHSRAVVGERTWAAVPDPAPGALEPIYVSFPTPPDAEALADAASLVATLEANCQIAREEGSPRPGATHTVERDAVGHRRLVRKRFSARR